MAKNKITVGVSAACGYPETPEDFAKKLCRAGVKQVEIFVNCESETTPEYASELRRILDGEGGRCVSLHPYTCAMDTYAMFSAYERRTQEYIDYHKRYFEAMNILGAEYFVFHGSKVNFGDEIIFGRFARLAEVAKSFGVKALQENVDRRVTGELETLKRMRAYFGEDAGFVLDTKQAIRMGWEAIDGVKALGDSIKHVHLSDHGVKGDCLLPGVGEMDIRGFIKALSDVGFEGCLMLELYRRNYGEIPDLVRAMRDVEKMVEEIYL